MTSACIFDDFQKHVASIRVQLVARRQVDRVCVIERSTVGNDFVCVVGVEGEEVGYLDSFGVNDGQPLPFLQDKGGSGPRLDLDCLTHCVCVDCVCAVFLVPSGDAMHFSRIPILQ